MPAPTAAPRWQTSPAATLFALMMLAHTLSGGSKDLARADMLHGVSALLAGALVATGWFRGHRAWLLLYVPMALAITRLGTPEPQHGPARLNVGLVILYTGVSTIGLIRLLPKPPWLQTARA